MAITPLRVLVVDEEPGIRRIFSMAMANYGFAVDGADSSTEALLLLDRGTYDVIVSDVHMPCGDGIDLLDAIRSRALLVPVIVMSGRPSREGKAAALARGALRYMIKPVMPSELRLVIESALATDRGAVRWP